MSSDGQDFCTRVDALRYYTGGRSAATDVGLGRWQLLGSPEQRLYGGVHRRIIEDDVPMGRALALARLLGCEAEALDAMRSHAKRLERVAADRLQTARLQRAQEEERAIEERAAARRVLAAISTVERMGRNYLKKGYLDD